MPLLHTFPARGVPANAQPKWNGTFVPVPTAFFQLQLSPLEAIVLLELIRVVATSSSNFLEGVGDVEFSNIDPKTLSKTTGIDDSNIRGILGSFHRRRLIEYRTTIWPLRHKCALLVDNWSLGTSEVPS